MILDSQTIPSSNYWHLLAEQALAGEPISREQAEEILASDNDSLLDLIAAAYRLRHRYFAKTVQLYFLVNAKSGLCPEDCGYCSQSKLSTAAIDKYRMMSVDQLLDGARVAAQRDSKTYCIVISGRAPSERELKAVEMVVPRVKEEFNLKICACLGLLTPENAARLKACGVDPRLSLVLLAYAVAAVLGMIPITPGGVGFVEAGLTAMLVLSGVPSEKALLATLAYRIASYWLPLPAGLGAHFIFRHRYGKSAAASPDSDPGPGTTPPLAPTPAS